MKPNNLSNNLVVIQRVLDKRGTKSTTLLLDADYNNFYLVDDDDNYYLVNGDIEGTLNTILSAINEINSSIDNCPPCITNSLSQILYIVSTIPNESIKEVILASIMSSNDSISTQLESVMDKIKNETIIIQEKRVEVVKEKIVEKPVIVNNYIEIRTTKYIRVSEEKPDRVDRLPPTTTPPNSIPGWIFDTVRNYYYKIKRGVKYISVQGIAVREEDWIKQNRVEQTVRERTKHLHFGK